MSRGPWGAAARRLARWRDAWERQAAIRAWTRAHPAAPADDEPVTLARVVGNDLHPRHADGQSLRNLAFILAREPAFDGCRKLFVINRLIDPARAREAEAMVAAAGHAAIVLPFVPEDYARIAPALEGWRGPGRPGSPEFAALPPAQRMRALMRAAAPKIRYAMNVNGARNAALDWGRARGGWTLVLDGSCFVTAEAYARLRADMAAAPRLPYLVVPMRRLTSNDDVDRVATSPATGEEPQIALHASARERFDEAYPYGVRDKTSLLERLGVPGPWSGWPRLGWIEAPAAPSPDRHLWKLAGASVLRLSSGVDGGALERADAQPLRFQTRNDAILRTLAHLDARFGAAGIEAEVAAREGAAEGLPGGRRKASGSAGARRGRQGPPPPRAEPVPPEELRRRTLVIGLGAMKSGTTWLSAYLASHPQFHHSIIKEMNTFNRFYPNPFHNQHTRFRLFQMERLILDHGPEGIVRQQPRLRALAQLGRIRDVDDYLAYFAETIGDETHFGEISPNYAGLPPEALRLMASITHDVRFLFLMRDPTRRAASHIRHLRRRERADEPIAALLEKVAPRNHVYMCSNYGLTLDALEKAGMRDRTRLMIFETLFRAETTRGLCDWLGLPDHPPETEERRNEGIGEDLTPAQMTELRERLDPVYVGLRRRGLRDAAPGWWWDGLPADAA